jgi:hypothetical protein
VQKDRQLDHAIVNLTGMKEISGVKVASCVSSGMVSNGYCQFGDFVCGSDIG